MKLINRFKAAMDVIRGRDPRFSGVGGIGSFGLDSLHGDPLRQLLGIFAGSDINFKQELGDLSLNSLVMAAVNWLGMTLPEAPLQVVEPDGSGQNKAVLDHPLVSLWKRPNRYYSGALLWRAFALSWFVDGNVYLLKVRDLTGEVVELWYLPHFMVRPQWPTSGTPFISHYLYTVDGMQFRLELDDVVHFRYGIDPNNPRCGYSPAQAVMRELYTDHEAANFSAQMLKNFGIPGVIISPEGQRTVGKEEREILKSEIGKFGGDGRFKPMALSGAIKVSTLSFDLDQMKTIDQRYISEERWCAATGIPAIVLNLGSGMRRSTFSNFAEAREAAYESFLLPTQELIAADMTVQILSEFEGEKSNRAVAFDISKVRVLQDDRDKLYARITRAWKEDLMKHSEARAAIGLPADPARAEQYYSQTRPQPKTPAGNENQPSVAE
jgi:HK97 family phage portal protein